MADARVIPGSVAVGQFKALVLATTKNPALQVVRRSDRQAVLSTLTPLRPQYSAELAAELAVYGIELFELVGTGLAESTEYAVEDRTSGPLRETIVRTLPSHIGTEGLTIAVGSCYYEGFGKAEGYLTGLHSARFSRPAFKLLVGDNLYVDIGTTKPGRDTGYSETVDRYLTYFWNSHYADVLSTLPTFMTWDDHEFWNNYPESQTWLARSWLSGEHRPIYIQAAKECQKLFQKTLNPPSVGQGHNSYIFDIPPISFFIADTRTERSLYDDADRCMFSPQELQAFENWAANLKAPGVLVMGQPLWLPKGGMTDYNPADFEVQYARMWKAIDKSPFDILVISGDVHYSRVLEIALRNRTLREFVTSPACHIPTVMSSAGGSYSEQGQGEVKITKSVEIDAVISGGVKPRLSRYLFGTDVQNTIAFLHFRRKSDTAIDVGGVFVDLDTQKVPAATKADLPGWFSGKLDPVFQECQAFPMFTLR